MPNMNGRTFITPPQAQQGAAALIMMIILVLGASYYFVGALNRASSQTERDRITAAALAQAKEALIGRAITDENRPGSLPCPDTDGDGSSEGILVDDCNAYIGRLPWRTLRLPDIRDGAGEHLWYALSPNFRDDDSAQPINTNSPGMLNVIGNIAVANVVAIVFSPGAALGAQPRDVPNENNIANYLEGENVNGNNTFFTGASTPQFNDQLLPITHDELFRAVEKRVAAEIRGVDGPPIRGLKGYYDSNHAYPGAGDAAGAQAVPYTASGAVPYNDLSLVLETKNWLINNGWFALATYAVATNFQQGTVYPQQCGAGGAGCLNINGYPLAQAVVTVGTQSVAVCTTNPVVASCP